MPDLNTPATAPLVAFVGFGEAGERFARAGQWRGHSSGWDLKPERRALMADCGVETGGDAGTALANATVVLSLVTADAALAVTGQYAHLLPKGALWCDMNSVAPDTKRAAAEVVEAAGSRYVDVAVMAPVDAELAVPLLLAGPHSQAAEQLLLMLGFSNVRLAGENVGRASAIKMIRSVMVKGIEALSWECAAAAEAAGVYDEIVSSLDGSEKSQSWATRFAYNRERMEVHGLRRAAEMEESAKTLQSLGVEPIMTRGTVTRQREAAGKKS